MQSTVPQMSWWCYRIFRVRWSESIFPSKIHSLDCQITFAWFQMAPNLSETITYVLSLKRSSTSTTAGATATAIIIPRVLATGSMIVCIGFSECCAISTFRFYIINFLPFGATPRISLINHMKWRERTKCPNIILWWIVSVLQRKSWERSQTNRLTHATVSSFVSRQQKQSYMCIIRRVYCLLLLALVQYFVFIFSIFAWRNLRSKWIEKIIELLVEISKKEKQRMEILWRNHSLYYQALFADLVFDDVRTTKTEHYLMRCDVIWCVWKKRDKNVVWVSNSHWHSRLRSAFVPVNKFWRHFHRATLSTKHILQCVCVCACVAPQVQVKLENETLSHRL